MSLSYAEAYNEVAGLFAQAWQTTGYPVVYPDKASTVPSDENNRPRAWARFTYEIVSAEQATLGERGNRRFRRDGLVQVQIFTAAGDGLRLCHELTKLVCDAFEGYTDSENIWFSSVFPQRPVPDGPWTMTTVVAQFQYDEVK